MSENSQKTGDLDSGTEKDLEQKDDQINVFCFSSLIT